MGQILIESLEKIGIKISRKQEEQFDAYQRLLDEWNKVMNLVKKLSEKKSRYRNVTDGTVTNKMPEGGFKIC